MKKNSCFQIIDSTKASTPSHLAEVSEKIELLLCKELAADQLNLKHYALLKKTIMKVTKDQITISVSTPEKISEIVDILASDQRHDWLNRFKTTFEQLLSNNITTTKQHTLIHNAICNKLKVTHIHILYFRAANGVTVDVGEAYPKIHLFIPGTFTTIVKTLESTGREEMLLRLKQSYFVKKIAMHSPPGAPMSTTLSYLTLMNTLRKKINFITPSAKHA
jgi:hypothetical protein